MYTFKKITATNGFDTSNLNNARQNNYAWAVAELGNYIYYGTGRNILYNVVKSLNPLIQAPDLIKPMVVDNAAEIWRHKKNDEVGGWERVFKSPLNPISIGFRAMINFSPNGGSPCLIAAGYGGKINMYKSTNGVDWFLINNGVNLQGTSSRAMVVINDVLYVATLNELVTSGGAYLYSSKDPEFYPWENIIDTSNPRYDVAKNPTGQISNMVVFNKRLYLGISTKDGCQVWRSNGEVPKINEWTLIVDKGFGDGLNENILSMGVFCDGLYVSATKPLPLAWALPMGFDLIRIDKRDNWRLIVGGIPFEPVQPTKGKRGRSASGYWSGFSNPFNVYAWQIQEYNGKLLISTFDDSSNMEVILTTLLANREALNKLIGEKETTIIIEVYKGIIRLLNLIKYPYGFDFYESRDGIHFRPIFKNGICNRANYGGRTLFVDSCDRLYLGTANPFQGCEVYSVKENLDSCRKGEVPYYSQEFINEESEDSYKWIFKEIQEEINKHYNVLDEKLPLVMKYLSDHGYHISL
ncbi:MAG: hypothetical protein RR128_02410 [Clostridium sp.]